MKPIGCLISALTAFVCLGCLAQSAVRRNRRQIGWLHETVPCFSSHNGVHCRSPGPQSLAATSEGPRLHGGTSLMEMELMPGLDTASRTSYPGFRMPPRFVLIKPALSAVQRPSLTICNSGERRQYHRGKKKKETKKKKKQWNPAPEGFAPISAACVGAAVARLKSAHAFPLHVSLVLDGYMLRCWIAEARCVSIIYHGVGIVCTWLFCLRKSDICQQFKKNERAKNGPRDRPGPTQI